MNIKNGPIFILLVLYFLTGCMRQYSSLKRIKEDVLPSDSVSVIKYTGKYKMNMSKSDDVIVYLLNLKNKKEYAPKIRSNDGMTAIVLPEGVYTLSRLIMREPQFVKCISFDTNTNNYTYGFSNYNCDNLRSNRIEENLSSGTMMLGKMKLGVNTFHFNEFAVENGNTYYADSVYLFGKIEGLLKDLPNLEIQQKKSNKSPSIKFFKSDSIYISRKNQ